MYQVKLPYGKGYILGEIPYAFENVSISEEAIQHSSSEEIIRALKNPIGASLADIKGAKNVVIVTSDLTRPVPNKLILPPLLEELEAVGIKKENITVLIGTGLHRVSPEEEFAELVGEELAKEIKVISHDAWDEENLVYLGKSSRNTPIVINKHYAEADAKIVLGVIDPHQFAGISGGAKGVVIGVGGEKLVQANHSMLTHPQARLGIIEGNPVREDIDEIGGIIGIDFIVNVVLNSKKEVVKAVAGHFVEAHRVGVEIARKTLQVELNQTADLIIAASGGFPKDVNLYQAQKALLHAAIAVKEGGTIILVAKCDEGVGEERFTEQMKKAKTPQQILDNFTQEEFRIGAHKAYLWGTSLIKARVILVADGIDPETARIMQVEKADTLQQAIDMAIGSLPENPKIYVMPKAPSTIPLMINK
ncbi:MAG: nickel-dependent lactate racemase [Clostridia bacterium]|nr:nickel-dependent lactate racemase [Clostridia bacterium]